MLNGKFYTGLPPKMLERTTVAQNRLESHLFWPDDTHVDTPQEARIKRRSSFQNDTTPTQIEKNNFQRQTSWSNDGRDDIDTTKQRFHKEFAKSSIKFFDNIQEEDGNAADRHENRIQQRKNLRRDITIKPTAMKMQLPKNYTAHDEYAAIKKKQTFSSKIEFFDFVEGEGNTSRQNNKIKPKMDMNDKKEVERHTKNSPKLQVKGGIERNLRLVDEQRNNDVGRYYERQQQQQQYDNDDDRSDRQFNNGNVEPKTRRYNNISHNRSNYKSPIRRNSYNENDDHNDDYEYNERRAMPRAQSVPKKILKNPIKDERDYNEDYNGFKNDLEYVEQNTRNMRIRNSPQKKHVTYGEEVYEYEVNNDCDERDRSERNNRRERDERNYNRDHDERNNYRERNVSNNMRTRDVSNKMTDRDESINMREQDDNNDNYREHHKEITSKYRSSARNGVINAAHSTRNELKTVNRQTTGNNPNRYERNDEQQYNESKNRKPWNYNNNNNEKNNNIKLNNNQQLQQQQQRRNTPKMSLSLKTTSTPTNDTLTSPTSPTMDSQKHLRSSLCFHGGEIVANNNREGTPTSESNSRHRTARSAATNGRVCVGLPD